MIVISILCRVFYYLSIACRRLGTLIVMPRLESDVYVASVMVSMIPFYKRIVTPLFGTLVDRKGNATKLRIVGAGMVLCAHLIIAFAPGVPFFGYLGIAILGVGYSLVPAAMWPSVPKIIPEKNLGTAYSLIYWIQNMGLLAVPILVGFIIQSTQNKYAGTENVDVISAVNAELLFIGLAIVAILVAITLNRLSKQNPQLRLDIPNKAKK